GLPVSWIHFWNSPSSDLPEIFTSPIVGVTKPAQLADALAAVDVALDDDEAAYLEEPYQPHEVAYLEESFYKSRPAAGSR
ncbi:hypothetical protein ABZ726_35745, partial [Streptomyces hundungensis]